MRRSDGSIKKKLTFIMIYMIVLIFFSNIIMFGLVNNLTRQLDSVYSSNVDLNELQEQLNELQKNLYNYLKVRDYDSLQEYYRVQQDLNARLFEMNDDVTGNKSDILEKNIKNMSYRFIRKADDSIAAKRGMQIEDYKANYEEAMNIYGYINSDIDELNETLLKNNAASYRSLQSALGILEAAVIGVLAIIMIFGIYVMTKMTNEIVAPLTLLSKKAELVGEGDFNQKLDIESGDDEIGIVTNAFNGMVDSLNEYMIRVKESADKELMMENHLKEARLRFLQAQINPHFLFNSLNAGVQLAEMENDEKTSVFLNRMADFFRYNVKKTTEDATLEEEVKLVDDYIYIQNVRFAGDIVFIKDIDESVLGYRIPSMILEPLVENSLQHGIRDDLSSGHIKLEIRDKKTYIYICVSDNGKGIDEETRKKILGSGKIEHDDDSTGIGMDNVFSRLDFYFGDNASYNIKSGIDGKGTEVILKIPKKE
ncbi:MAG: histidine kinase [Lachnospiraceae bacterium]|nr:HAMP domain-containing protein [Lachnospiraceae bacterium XPB1003]